MKYQNVQPGMAFKLLEDVQVLTGDFMLPKGATGFVTTFVGPEGPDDAEDHGEFDQDIVEVVMADGTIAEVKTLELASEAKAAVGDFSDIDPGLPAAMAASARMYYDSLDAVVSSLSMMSEQAAEAAGQASSEANPLLQEIEEMMDDLAIHLGSESTSPEETAAIIEKMVVTTERPQGIH